jgi:hypothetical protein
MTSLAMLMIAFTAAMAGGTSDVRVHHVVYARELSRIGKGQAGAIEMMTRDVFVLGKEMPKPTNHAERTFLIARGAAFAVGDEKPLEPALELWLVDTSWAPCKGLARRAVAAMPEGGTTAVEALELEGCATHPNRYAAWAIEGPVTEILAIGDSRAGRADDPGLRQLNELLRKAGAKVAPIRPRPAGIARTDPRVRTLVTAAAADPTLKDFEPRLYLAASNHRALVVLEKEADQTLALVELQGGKLKTLQLEKQPW